jgi:hypothetical protein
MNIGQTILQQIKTYNPMDLMCWGVKNPLSFTSGQLIPGGHQGGLLFKVNGILFKGHIVITLEPSDTYSIRLGKFVKSTGKFTQMKETTTDVYCDNLNQVIDSLIEGYYAKGAEAYRGVNIFDGV